MNYVFIAKTLKTEGLFLLLGELFIEGACDRFLLSDFPVFGKKQICMDGEQMGELALII